MKVLRQAAGAVIRNRGFLHRHYAKVVMEDGRQFVKWTERHAYDNAQYFGTENLKPLEKPTCLYFTITAQDEWIRKDEEGSSIKMRTTTQGAIGVYPTFPATLAELPPQIIEVAYVDGKKGTEKWAISGGWMDIGESGTVDLLVGDAFLEADLDAKRLQKEFESAKADMASSKNDKEKAFAAIRMTVYENLTNGMKGL